MAATGTVTIQATVSPLASGTKSVGPLTITAAAANCNTVNYRLAVGFNTITLPIATATPATTLLAGPQPTGAIIIPPSGNTSAMVLKGVTGDTGIKMHLTNPFYIGFPASSPDASFGITVTTAAVDVEIVWI